MTGTAHTRITMQTDTLGVAVLPALGGKIASLRWLARDLELLQSPLIPYAPRTMIMRFEESDASGWDECLPSVSACALRTVQGPVDVPDHGDFWRLAWECEETSDAIRMMAMGASLPLRLERTLRLSGNEMQVEYRVQNVGEGPVEYVWSAHPSFAVNSGDRIVLPNSVKRVRVEASARQRLGGKGTEHAWPRTRAATGGAVDLSVAGGIEDGVGDKVFAVAPAEGWVALARLTHGIQVEMKFDARRTSWLGLWLCYGGWPEGRVNRQQCVAIEPCTAPADSLAEAVEQGWTNRLGAGESETWTLQVQVKPAASS